MRIKVYCRAVDVPPIADGNTSFPANAEAHLRAAGMVNLVTTYEAGYPIYGGAPPGVEAAVRALPWVVEVTQVPRKERPLMSSVMQDCDRITFADFVQYGLRAADHLVNGEPWSFRFHGHPVTQENPSLYLISTPTGMIHLGPEGGLLVDQDRNITLVACMTNTSSPTAAQLHAEVGALIGSLPMNLRATPTPTGVLQAEIDKMLAGPPVMPLPPATPDTPSEIKIMSASSDRSIRNTPKPDKPYDHVIGLPGAPSIACHQDTRMAGAFMKFDDQADGQLLNLVVDKWSMTHAGPATYAGYRDGVCRQADKLAIIVDHNKQVSLQIILPGDGEEGSRTKQITLQQLEQAVANLLAAHPEFDPPPAPMQYT